MQQLRCLSNWALTQPNVQGLEDSVREDVQIVKNHALLQDVPTHGFVYDVKTGALNPVS